jgi:hypothetical protein
MRRFGRGRDGQASAGLGLTVSTVLTVLTVSFSPSRLSAQLVHDPFPVRLVFTGDINLGTRTLPDGLPPDSGRRLFAGVDSLLQGDLVIGNFEGVLSDSGESEKCAPKSTTCYAFATPAWLAPRLREAGFTHLNLANNHANDYGLAARLDTQSALRALGLTVYGPIDLVAITPVWRDDRYMLVGIVGFATYPHAYNLLDLAASAEVVATMRPLVDVLVVTFHGGREGATAVRTPSGPEFLGREPRGNLRRWARTVIDAGADAVIGHGPHVLRGAEFWHGRPIFYSLGNFVTWRGFNLEGPLGLTTVLQLDLDLDGSFRGARMPSLVQRPDSGTGPDPTHRATALLRRITRLDFPGTGARFADDGTVTAP